MKRIGGALADGRPVDSTHYRWFTEQNSPAFLSAFGRVEELLTLPNTHHSLATVRIH